MDKLRNSEAFKLLAKKPAAHVITKPPVYFDDNATQPLKLKINIKCYNYHYNKASPAAQGFLTLLKYNKFAPVPKKTSGLTWLELLLLSLAASPNPKTTEMRRTATRSPTIGIQVTRFRVQVQQLIRLVLGEADQQLFKTSRSTDNRLESLGYSNQLPHTSCQMAVSTQLATTMHKALLTIHAPLTKKQQHDLDRQRLYAPVHRFNSK
eukprot:4738558-Karenia_brevis.AAC.1